MYSSLVFPLIFTFQTRSTLSILTFYCTHVISIMSILEFFVRFENVLKRLKLNYNYFVKNKWSNMNTTMLLSIFHYKSTNEMVRSKVVYAIKRYRFQKEERGCGGIKLYALTHKERKFTNNLATLSGKHLWPWIENTSNAFLS